MQNEKKINYERVVILLIGLALIFLIFILVRNSFSQKSNTNNEQPIKVVNSNTDTNQVIRTEFVAPQTEEEKKAQAEAIEQAKKFQAVGEILNNVSIPSDWSKFNSLIGNFSVAFPQSPKHETINVNVPDAAKSMKYDMYTGEAVDGSIYFVGFSSYPLDINDSNYEKILRESLNGIVSVQANNKLISAEPSFFNGHHSLNCLIYNADNVYTKGRIVIVGSNIYHILATVSSEKYNDGDYNAFMSSFTLK